MMARVWTVARRELQALFDHPTGYVLLVVFTAVNGFLFVRQAFLIGLASLRPMLDLLPWLFLFFVPAVAVMFVLILVGLDPLLVGLPPTLGAIAARVGVLAHFHGIARGVIELRDVVYFLSLAGVFLTLAYGALLGRKLSRAGAARWCSRAA